MKTLPTFIALAAVLAFSTPEASAGKDRHHHDHGKHSYHRHGHSQSCYRGPSVSYRSYRPSSYYSPYYSAYPYGYSSYPYYYGRPSVGISLSTGPSYATYSRTIRTGNVNDALAEDVQRALARRGYYKGPIDGDVGLGTRGAIREYQYRNRLEVTGRIDRSLLRSLGVG